jgi:hypothetical protein
MDKDVIPISPVTGADPGPTEDTERAIADLAEELRHRDTTRILIRDDADAKEDSDE